MNLDSIVQEPKNILLCQQRQIGDVVLTTPLVALLAKRFPHANIHFFTEKKCASVLENNPYIYKVWAFDKKKENTIIKELLFYKQIVATTFDIVVDCQQLPRIQRLVFMSRAPIRIGISKRWYIKYLYTHYAKEVDPDMYAVAIKSSVLSPLGIEWNGESPEIYLTKEEQEQAQSLFSLLGVEKNPVISIDVTHQRKTRCWPAINYASLIDTLAEKYPSFLFFLPYGPGERANIIEVQSLSRFPEKILIPNEVISLRLMAACISNCLLHIGNCSAPRHLAVSVGTPTVTIHGATSKNWTFPSVEHKAISLGLPCQPCNKNSCDKEYACLYSLSPAKVFEEVSAHLTLCTTQY